MPDLSSKEALRKTAKQKRAELSLSFKESAEKKATKNFLDNIATSSNVVISAYYPTNNELSTIELLKQLSARGITTCLPVVTGRSKPLVFKEWKFGDKLIEGKFFNLPEPEGKKVTPDIIILPLLAFDKELNRLGYGGGFFDRTLEHLKANNNSYISVGYSYKYQQIDEVPTNEPDIPLNYVITEEQIFKKIL